MDFPTRNLYRAAIEQLARGSKSSELDIARAAIAAVRESRQGEPSPQDERLSDPGYYLLAAGRAQFEARIEYHRPMLTKLGRLARAAGIGGYVSAIGFAASLLLAIPLAILSAFAVTWVALILLGVIGLIPAIDAAVALVNRSVSLGFHAKLLPALALRNGLPDDLRTLVAVPTMLTSADAIAEQIERLEIHHLAGPDENLHFALLSDWIRCRCGKDRRR